jgi:hypothetical protein
METKEILQQSRILVESREEINEFKTLTSKYRDKAVN